MSSLKMTFSLTSLILIIGLVFVPASVMAATGGPTPTITEYSGLDMPNEAAGATNLPHEQVRTDFRLLVTFDALVTDDLIESEFAVSVAEGLGKAAETTSASGIGTITAITRGSNAGKAFMVEVDLNSTASDNHNAGTYSFGYVSFVVNADAVTGNQAGHSTNGLENVRSSQLELTSRLPKNNDWTYAPALGSDAPDIAMDQLTGASTFTVEFTLSGGTTAMPSNADILAQIQILDDEDEAVEAASIARDTATDSGTGTVRTFIFTVATDPVDTPVTIGINPNWAAGTTLKVPADPPETPTIMDIGPTVDISLVGTNDTAKTFEVKFTFAEATPGTDEKALPVPLMLGAGDIKITKEDPADPTMKVPSDAYVQGNIISIGGGTGWLVTINYRLDALPLFVELADSVSVSDTTIEGTPSTDDSPALMVGTSTPTPMPPGVPTNVSATADQAANTITVTWDAVTGADSYEVTKLYTDADGMAQTKVLPDADDTDTTITIPPAGEAPLATDVMFTFTVTATNADGTSAPSAVSNAVQIDDDGSGGPGTGGPTPVDGKTDEIFIRTVNDSSGPIELGGRFTNSVIPAHGWAVLVRDVEGSEVYDPYGAATWILSESTSLPDLALFFGGSNGINSGTISLHRPADYKPTVPRATVSDDIVISEIMWGYNNERDTATRACSQWIEFYNTTPLPIDLTGWTINFHRSLVDESRWDPPGNTDLIDIASNAGVTDRNPVHLYHEPWAPKGQSGVYGTTYPVTPLDIVSMFLEINYTQAPGVKHAVIPSGADGNQWSASVHPQGNLPYGIVGTPGSATVIRIDYTETPISQALIINEIGNSSTDAYDWVEIYNPGTAAVNIKNMMFTTVTHVGNVGKEEILFRFPNADFNIQPGHYVVYAASDPKNDGNDLAAGIDVTKSDIDQRNKGLGSKVGIEHQANNTTAFYRIHSAVKLPNNALHRLYILRSNTKPEHIGAHPDAQKNVVDVIGSLGITLRNRTPAGWTNADVTVRGLTSTGEAHVRRIYDTTMWPLQWAVNDPGKKHPHAKRVDGDAKALGVGKVYHRNGKNLPNAENHITTPGYTGIGYDRHAEINAENHGTPGYANNAVKSEKSNWNMQVSISEIMLATHESEDAGARIPRAVRLPQWIEIFNSSLTEGVNIGNWYLELRNADSEDLITRDLHGTLRLPSVIIPPNQTILIVSSSGLHSANFPDQRVINLFTNSNARNVFSLVNRNDPVLSQVGFYIQLRDHKNQYVDEVGNLPPSDRRGIEARGSDNFTPVWDLPEMNHPDGPRTSLIRIYDEGIPNDGLMKVAELGTTGLDPLVGWRRAVDTTFRNVPTLSYYGNQRDYGTPGYRGGGPLPVSLSKFRPERLESGDVVIRWVTESELNNAGFNILRSDTRDGDFTQVNTKLIAGEGTTSERTTYEWKDSTAKPNVVYYYQIQDVSLDGQVQTLRVSRLKGNVSPAGKLTTTWGALKALQ